MSEIEPSSKRLRRWLAIVEGVMFFWLLVMVWCVVNILREWTMAERKSGYLKTMPDGIDRIWLTRLVNAAMPETGWSLLPSLVLFSAAFGLISSRSPEPLVSRVFRWTVAVLATSIFGACLPLLEGHNYLVIPESSGELDEVILLAAAIAAVFFSRRYAKKQP